MYVYVYVCMCVRHAASFKLNILFKKNKATSWAQNTLFRFGIVSYCMSHGKKFFEKGKYWYLCLNEFKILREDGNDCILDIDMIDS